MADRSSHAGFDDALTALFERSPQSQVVAGVVGLAIGLVLTPVLWEAGWIVSLTLLAIPVGGALVISGAKGMKEEAEERDQWRHFRRDRDALLEDLHEAKREGKRAVPHLTRRGFSSRAVRNHILEAYRDRYEA